jgi:hypothetical protein
LQNNFFTEKFFFCILEMGILAGKNLLIKRMNLLCKEGFSSNNNLSTALLVFVLFPLTKFQT